MSEAVLITGYGWISPLGDSHSANNYSPKQFDNNLFGGQSAVQARAVQLPGQDIFYAPVAPCAFNHANYQSASKIPLDRGTAMALCAARGALQNAGFSLPQGSAHASGDRAHSASDKVSAPELIPSFDLSLLGTDPTRVGVFWGSGMGGAFSFDQAAQQSYQYEKRIRPTTVLTIMPSSAASELALMINAQGACMTYACACASASVAIGEAFRALQAGWLDVALVGGSESMLSDGVLASWSALRVLAPVRGTDPVEVSSKVCSPFSADRAGFALGEGAGAFVLERADNAQKRGRAAKLALSGFASNCDASHMTHPNAAGQLRAMRAALVSAGLEASEIDYINAHATATALGDIAEVHSVSALFGQRVAISSSKAQFGHLLGAAGALELVVALRALERQMLPPNANTQRTQDNNADGSIKTAHIVDQAFDLNFVPDKGAPGSVSRVLSNSFAFGGTNAVLVASLLP